MQSTSNASSSFGEMMIDQLEKKTSEWERKKGGNRLNTIFRKGRSILMEFLYRQMLVMVVLFFFFFTTGHNPCRTMGTEQSNYDRVQWCWRLKLVLWVTVASVSDFLNNHRHTRTYIRGKGCSSIGLTSIQWENERRRRMKELFLLLLRSLSNLLRHQNEKNSVWMNVFLSSIDDLRNEWWFVLFSNLSYGTTDLVMIINLELCDTQRRCNLSLSSQLSIWSRKKFLIEFLRLSLGSNQSIQWTKISLENKKEESRSWKCD